MSNHLHASLLEYRTRQEGKQNSGAAASSEEAAGSKLKKNLLQLQPAKPFLLLHDCMAPGKGATNKLVVPLQPTEVHAMVIISYSKSTEP
jgi:hypothetical protein